MLSATVLAAQLILAAVFVVAGIAKLGDRRGTREAVVGFGVPGRIAWPVAVALPIAELTVAFLVLPGSTQVVGAAGALALLVVFSVTIAASLASGRAPECHCFGQLHSAPASWKTLVRNGGLAGLGVVVLVEGLLGTRPSALSWLGSLDATAMLALAAGVVAIGLGFALLAVTRAYGRVLLRVDVLERRLAEAGIALDDEEPGLGHAPGTPAPTLGAVDAFLARGKPVLFLFTSTSCKPCKELMPSVAAWQREHSSELTIALTEDERIHAAFEASGTPSAVLITPDGMIASWIAAGADAIERLLERALEESSDLDEEQGLPIGSPAPSLGLPSLDGSLVALDELAEEALVLFWNPDCGFCRSMLERLLVWERSVLVGSPRLLVVSSGDEKSSREDGFASTVLLDPEFEAGAAFGAGGTPMAVLVDVNGRIASPLAGGAEAVLELARSRGTRFPGTKEGVAV